MASLKEQTTATSQGVNLRDATLPNSDIQAVRENKGAGIMPEENSQGELYAQIPMIPPVLLSPTGIRLPKKEITVRVVATPSKENDIATYIDNINSKAGHTFGDAEAITNVESIPSMINKLIELSAKQGSKLKDIRILTHGAAGLIAMGDKDYHLSAHEVSRQFSRLRPYLANEAVITFHGCIVGQETEGLQKIANITGATVRASLDFQYPLPGLQGRVITITPKIP